jgi:hypothetical protein
MHLVKLADISSPCCWGLTYFLSLELTLLVKDSDILSITQEMVRDCLLRTDQNMGHAITRPKTKDKQAKPATQSSSFALGIAGGRMSQRW